MHENALLKRLNTKENKTLQNTNDTTQKEKSVNLCNQSLILSTHLFSDA